jgi:transcriptional regulator with XRE-family HTH domain
MVAVFSYPAEMAGQTRSGERQIHPTGDLITVDDAFKDRVRQELRERGWSQADLAEKISASPGGITGLLKPGTSQTRLYFRIIKLFGWADTSGPAGVTPLDDTLKRVTRKWPALTDADREIVRALVDSLASKR